MDHQAVGWNFGAFVAIVVGLSLLLVSPVQADGGSDPGMLVVSEPVWELPILPRTLQFPTVDHSDWPSTLPARNTLKAAITNRMTLLTTSVTRPLDWTLSRVSEFKSTIGVLQAIVGDPLQTHATDGYQQSVTIYSAATKMSSGMRVGAAYLRAISRIGPVGLNLTLVFAGLVWVIFINLLDLLFTLGTALVKIILKLVMIAIQIAGLLFSLLQLIIALIKLIWPF